MNLDEAMHRNAKLGVQVQRFEQDLKVAQLTIEKLKVEIAYLRRMKYGRSSEQLEHAQLDLTGGTVAPIVTLERPSTNNVTSFDEQRKKRARRAAPSGRGLPDHLPRRTVVHLPDGHQADCGCPACGLALREIGQDVSEVLDYEPGSFHVVRHVRPKLACRGCQDIRQAATPDRPIDRVTAGAGMLSHVLVSKYCDHTPLYRQAQIYARAGLELHRSTLTDWMAQAAHLLKPLAEAIGRYVLSAGKVHSDDTPIRALGGKGGKVHTGRLWVYVRDDRPSGCEAAPAVWFQYSLDRKGEHPAKHLKKFGGVLQADAFAGYNALYAEGREGGRIIEAGCWSHARRKLWDIHVRQHKLPGTLAYQGLQRISELYKIEAEIQGRPPDARRRVRRQKTAPMLKALREWMDATLAQVSAKSPMAQAIGYALSNWTALTRFVDDGRIEAHNNTAERALRGVALGRKNYLHLGSDIGSDSAAVIYTLVGSAKLNGIDPQRYLTHVLERIAAHPINRIGDLMPWAVAPQLRAAWHQTPLAEAA
ncbi:MAG: IS66 family transposase [Acidovorax sp.]